MSVNEDIGQRRRQSQHRLDFESICEPLTRFVASTHVPVTSFLLYSQNQIYRKTLLGAAPPRRPSSAPGPSQSSLQSEETDNSEGVPEALKIAKREEIDAVGGTTMFAIGSLVKPMVALACGIIIEKRIYKDLGWDTGVFTLLRKLYRNTALFRNVASYSELTVKDILLHRKALPDLDHALLLPDGTFQVNDKEFIHNLETIMQDSKVFQIRSEEPQGEYQYSNANTILIALLLVKRTRKSINDIIREHLFDPLGMHRTTLSSHMLDQIVHTPVANVARGCRMSSSLRIRALAPQHNYMDFNASAVMVGAWSCVDDLAKLYIAICEATDGENIDPSTNSTITWDMAFKFLFPHFGLTATDLPPTEVAFSGLVYDLRNSAGGTESLNHVVRQLKESEQQMPIIKHKYLKLEDGSQLHYKGGTIDGFTGSIYLQVQSGTFAISLSNAAGPVDVTDPIARYLVDSALQVEDGVDTRELIRTFEAETQDQLMRACELWRELENQDANFTDWINDLELHVGTYKHESHGLELEITRDGRAKFTRGERPLTTMKIRELDGKLRLFPMTEGVFIDRLTTFKDATLIFKEDEGKFILWSNRFKDKYIKQ